MARPGAALLILLWIAGLGGRAENPNESLLDRAVRNGSVQEVEHLLASGADPNAPDDRGNPPLLVASWNGNTAVIASFLNHGANVNARNAATGSTALLYGVLSGREATVRLLLSKGARTDFKYRGGQTVLHIAAGKGLIPVLEALLAAHADVSAADERGNNVLDEAVLQDHLAGAVLLLRHGADPGRVHPLDGRGALHEACIKGFANLIEPLIAAGADPVQADRFGLTPLDLALDYKNGNVVSTLLRLAGANVKLKAAAEAAMESATLRGQTEIAKLLIQSGLAINKPTAGGSTYLNDAALKGKKDLVRLLLDRGADVNARDEKGSAPLDNAALGGDPEVIGILLERGARIDSRDTDSQATALMIAASLGRSAAIAVLLQRGANPSLRDRLGRSALDRAKQTGDTATIRLLKKAAAGAPPLPTSRSKPRPARALAVFQEFPPAQPIRLMTGRKQTWNPGNDIAKS